MSWVKTEKAMRAELNRIMNYAVEQTAAGKSLALVTIVRTEGSSYRKKGVQMLLNEDLEYVGAISGGCVENAVLREAKAVFQHKQNVLFAYDGQYKLGCNGTIYILIELLQSKRLNQLLTIYQENLRTRKPIYLHLNRVSNQQIAHTAYEIEGQVIRNSELEPNVVYDDVEQLEIPPQQQLVVIGGEHDSVSLASLAHQVGFQVNLVVKESFRYQLPEGVKVFYAQPEELTRKIQFDKHSAIVLMTHSLSKDLNFLQVLVAQPSFYLGALGPETRKNTLINNLLEMYEPIFMEYGDKVDEIQGPVGLPIGAQTPEEISISILSEIIGTYHRQLDKERTLVPENM